MVIPANINRMLRTMKMYRSIDNNLFLSIFGGVLLFSPNNMIETFASTEQDHLFISHKILTLNRHLLCEYFVKTTKC